MRVPVLLLALGGLTAAACFTVQPPPPPAPATMSVWSPTGGFTMNYGSTGCAGQITLLNGFATVNDPCFTGNNNVVICSDSTAPNPVKCAAVAGALLVQGTGGDEISYARAK